MNSMPEELDELERKIRQLEIDREAIKRENDELKLKELSTEISNYTVQRDTLKAKSPFGTICPLVRNAFCDVTAPSAIFAVVIAPSGTVQP